MALAALTFDQEPALDGGDAMEPEDAKGGDLVGRKRRVDGAASEPEDPDDAATEQEGQGDDLRAGRN